MSILTKLNSKGNIRRTSSADMPYSAQFPVLNQYTATSTTGQTTINLPFSISQSAKEALQLYVDGKLLREGVGNDYQFTAVDANNTSSRVVLNFSLSAGLNIIAVKLGFKKEVEFNTDNRFVQLFDNQGQAFQGFIDTNTSRLVAVATPGTPNAGTFYSSIQNRASITDITQDLKVRFGLERIPFQNLYQINSEAGPSGEAVWGLTNDNLGLVRFVGGGWRSDIENSGQATASFSQNDYLEVTFYGTGLNLLTANDVASRDYRVSVDGGISGANIYPGVSTVITDLNYNSNIVVQAISGLALGVHTVRVLNNSANTMWLSGVEIINQNATSTNLTVNPGIGYVEAKRLNTNSQQAFGIDSMVNTYQFTLSSGSASVGAIYTNNSQTFQVVDFDAVNSFLTCAGTGAPTATGNLVKLSGTGTDPLPFTFVANKGGRVLVCQDSNGEITTEWNPTSYQFLTLANANHSNEELARAFSPTEFRSDIANDFSDTTAGSTQRGFVLSDSATTLFSSGSQVVTSALGTNRYGLSFSVGNAIFFTFVGTGLDVELEIGPLETSTITIFINGATIGNLTYTAGSGLITYKIASGLAYGTHSVAITASAPTQLLLTRYLVYQPKKPTLPSGAIELADYNLVARPFVNIATAGVDRSARGVLRNSAMHEVTYSGTWTRNLVTNTIGQFHCRTSTATSYFEYTFFGTGFDIRLSTPNAVAGNYTMTIDGVAPSLVNFPASTSGFYGGITGFTQATGVITTDTSGTNASGMWISGLPLGLHRVRVTYNSGTWLALEAIDVIAPIHSFNLTTPYVEYNSISIASREISDQRAFSAIKENYLQQKNVAQVSKAYTTPTTTSTTPVTLPLMNLVHTNNSGKVLASYAVRVANSTLNQDVFVSLFVDGVDQDPTSFGYCATSATANADSIISVSRVVNVSPGTHSFALYWYVTAGTGSAFARVLTVEEI